MSKYQVLMFLLFLQQRGPQSPSEAAVTNELATPAPDGAHACLSQVAGLQAHDALPYIYIYIDIEYGISRIPIYGTSSADQGTAIGNLATAHPNFEGVILYRSARQ